MALKGVPGGASGKCLVCASECRRPKTQVLIPGSGRSPGRGNDNPPVFLLGKPMDRGASRATVHKVAKSQTQLK